MGYSPANIALCAWNSLPPTANVTSLKRSLSNRLPKSSDNLHSGTLNWMILLCPEILTLSATTLTSQNIVNLSSGNSPFASSNRKSRRMNFLKPQSLPWTNRYALRKRETENIWMRYVIQMKLSIVWWTYTFVIPLLWSPLVLHSILRIWISREPLICCRILIGDIRKDSLCFLRPDLSDSLVSTCGRKRTRKFP